MTAKPLKGSGKMTLWTVLAAALLGATAPGAAPAAQQPDRDCTEAGDDVTYEEADVELIWTREPHGDWAVARATVGHFRRSRDR